jgi:predicted esterase
VAFFIYISFMQTHHLSIEFKARFSTLGELTSSTKQIWFVLHGYGQLAPYFIHKFDKLKDNSVYVIAPEGLSRFYTEPLQSTGRSNDRVGASLMTKENRLVDIENYITYLNTLHSNQIDDNCKLPTTILGFSQGAATASRWVSGGNVPFERLILWSGVFPHDMNFESGRQSLHGKEVSIVYGKNDPFLEDSQFESLREVSSKLGITPEYVSFDGGHEIEEKTLLNFL